MKDLTTFYQICIYITVVMVVFILALNFVVGLQVFPIIVESGFQTGDGTTDEVFSTITNVHDASGNEGFAAMNNLVLGVGALAGLGAGLALGYLFQSTTLIAVSLFTGIFWSAYINTLSVLKAVGFLQSLTDYGFMLIGTVAMLFIFAGAVTGMLSGSG